MSEPSQYEKVELEEVRCPNCGNEDDIKKQQRTDDRAQPVPPRLRATCPECDEVGDPIAWHHEYKRARMSDEEIAEAERQQAKMEDEMADYEYSAHAISVRREP